MAFASPFFNSLSLEKYGLEFIQPGFAFAHPFDDGSAAVLTSSLEETAELLGPDKEAYRKLILPIVKECPLLIDDLLAPLRLPKLPFLFAKFGWKALPSSLHSAAKFQTIKARGLWAGVAAHAIQPLSNLSTSAIGLVLTAAAHVKGWSIPKGGSQSIANALLSVFIEAGGKIQTGFYVKSLEQLPSSHAILLDVTPRQLLEIAGHRFSSLYKYQLEKYRYGMEVFKIDWALDAAIPFSAPECLQAGTIHIGTTLEEITANEQASAEGKHPEKPFVLLAQQTVFDPSWAPKGKHTAWAYCHVPNGSTINSTEAIENQV